MKAAQTEKAYEESRPREYVTLQELAGQTVRLTDIQSYGEQQWDGDDKPKPFLLASFEVVEAGGKVRKGEQPVKINQAYLFPRVSWFFEAHPDETYDGVPTLGIPPGSKMKSNCWYFA